MIDIDTHDVVVPFILPELNDIVRKYLKCVKCDNIVIKYNKCQKCINYFRCVSEYSDIYSYWWSDIRYWIIRNSSTARYVLAPPKNIFVRIQCAIYNIFFYKQDRPYAKRINKFRTTQVRCHTEKYLALKYRTQLIQIFVVSLIVRICSIFFTLRVSNVYIVPIIVVHNIGFNILARIILY
jgi:hypothetical protein